ncbi:hypothetical protein HXA34_20410 [Salipaludibacillus agaradhaerens]|uniref:hypothetical protein n=1 Tax=Salipaludibacillus agaradhaerens TaxID=76935 RepID=UPI0021507F60|nr:hypothetical protein [Salipaludibacillus agaradhaerens]MCR6108661.1 hypothetical protein [Salipaludibacillus agaradhaerens]MCR6120685.1 hypothetical protein [Salipaludibacillus agaradhaerens]
MSRPYATPDEEKLINACIFLPMAIKTLERDLNLLEKSSLKIPEVYEEIIHRMILKMREDLREAKREMLRQKMKVWYVDQKDEMTTYGAVIRGYETKHTFWSYTLRHRTKEVLLQYS